MGISVGVKMNFCDKCNKIVPNSEVKDIFNIGKKTHVYTEYVNAYKNQQPGMIGCCLVNEEVWCGTIREPTDQEYFIYHTLGVND